MTSTALPEPVYGSPETPWRKPDGSIIACTEKLKVMRENLAEMRQVAQDLLEDAVLMGCDEAQGHYLGRPMEAAAIPDWLRQRGA